MPVDDDDNFRGLAVNCRRCGYSGAPLKAQPSLYAKAKAEEDDPVDDYYNAHMRLDGIFSRLALGSFCAALLSAVAAELQAFTMAAFLGFLLFSLLYGFVRVRDWKDSN
jgi:hypothetical protein